MSKVLFRHITRTLSTLLAGNDDPTVTFFNSSCGSYHSDTSYYNFLATTIRNGNVFKALLFSFCILNWSKETIQK